MMYPNKLNIKLDINYSTLYSSELGIVPGSFLLASVLFDYLQIFSLYYIKSTTIAGHISSYIKKNVYSWIICTFICIFAKTDSLLGYVGIVS